jgi:hypothetical protein
MKYFFSLFFLFTSRLQTTRGSVIPENWKLLRCDAGFGASIPCEEFPEEKIAFPGLLEQLFHEFDNCELVTGFCLGDCVAYRL